MLKTFIQTQSKSIIIIEQHFFGKNHKKDSFLCDLHLFYSIILLTKKLKKVLLCKKNSDKKFKKRKV